MEVLELLQQRPIVFYITIALLGLIVGSFLNVVIYRLPIMMERDWAEQCAELNKASEDTEDEAEDNVKTAVFNLSTPRSRCPQCNALITSLQNIPIISYLLMRGKCAHCKHSISVRYPLVELITALISLLIAWKFGATIQTLMGLVFIWTLISLAFIDFDTMYLPDNLTIPLLWLGLTANYFGVFTSLENSVLGAIIGYLSLWIIFHAFRLLTGKEGFGYGDFKLLAALGAWGGWQIIFPTVFVASLLGAMIGIILMVIKKDYTSKPMPFGPWLVIAGSISFIWKVEINELLASYLFI